MVVKRIMNHVSLLRLSELYFMKMYTQSTDTAKDILMTLQWCGQNKFNFSYTKYIWIPCMEKLLLYCIQKLCNLSSFKFILNSLDSLVIQTFPTLQPNYLCVLHVPQGVLLTKTQRRSPVHLTNFSSTNPVKIIIKLKRPSWEMQLS